MSLRAPRRPALLSQLLATSLLTLAVSSSSTIALLDDDTVKGAASNHVFSSSFGDSIDTLSGQLTFQIPLGPEFRTHDDLTYQVRLFYTSKTWRYNIEFWDLNPFASIHRHRLDGRAQGGVGFYLQMGRIYWKWQQPTCVFTDFNDSRVLVLQLEDGTEHDVTDAEISHGSSVLTEDNSTIKVAKLPLSDPNGGYEVWTLDGRHLVFDRFVPSPIVDQGLDPNNLPPDVCRVDGRLWDARSSDIGGWYPTSICHGSGAGCVTVAYESEPGMEHLIKEITDVTGRRIEFTNEYCNDAAGLWCEGDQNRPENDGERYLRLGYPTEIRFPAFGDSPSGPGTAVYSLSYEVADTTDVLIRFPGDDLHTLGKEVFLKSITFPEGYQTRFDYVDSNGHLGLITRRTLPTGAMVEYTYNRYAQATSGPIGSCFQSCSGLSAQPDSGWPPATMPSPPCGGFCGGSSSVEDTSATLGVIAKAVKSNRDHAGAFDPNDPNLGVQVDRWTWDRSFIRDPETLLALSNPWKVIETDPFNNWTVYLFAASTGPPSDPSLEYRYYQEAWTDGLPEVIDYYLGPGTILLQRVVKQYEDDTYPAFPGVEHTGRNRRVRAESTINFEAGAHTRRVESEEWDRYGHYRVKKEYKEDGTLYRTRRTGYNCDFSGDGSSCIDPNGTVPSGLTAFLDNFTMNTFTYDELLDADGNVISRSEFSFLDDGRMRRRIDRLAPGGPNLRLGNDVSTLQPGDVMTVYKYLGDADCGTTPACPADPDPASGIYLGNKAVEWVTGDGVHGPGDYTTTYTRDNPAFVSKKRVVGQGFEERTMWDVNAGLVATSRPIVDPSSGLGVPTAYGYDRLGRLTSAIRGEGASQEAPIVISYPNLFQTVVTQSSVEEPGHVIRAEYFFDQLSRPVKEKRWRQDGSVVEKHAHHDELGRRTFESEWGSSTEGTTYDYSYGSSSGSSVLVDPFERVHRLITPDGVTETSYQGRTTVVTVYGLGETEAGKFDATTVYQRDAFDRLWKVLSSQSADPDPLTLGAESPAANAEYHYDERDSLVQATLRDPADPNSPGQSRFFGYDALGRLVSSTNPENGTEVIEEYTTPGDVKRKRDPAGNTFVYQYDDARRLKATSVGVPGGSPQLVADLSYDQTVSGLGKLGLAVTYLPDGMSMSQAFHYDGLNRRLSRIDTTFPGATQPFPYDITYNDLGLVKEVGYPYNPALTSSRTELVQQYSAGLLTDIVRADLTPIIRDITYNAALRPRSMETAAEVLTEIFPDVRNRPSRIKVSRPNPEDPNSPGGGGGGGGGGGCPPTGCIGGDAWLRLPFAPSESRYIGQTPPPYIGMYDSGDYRYDPMGNILGIGADRFQYDGSGRLIWSKQTHGGIEHTMSYAYDALGNLLSTFHLVDPLSGASTTIERGYDVDAGTNRLASRSESVDGGTPTAIGVSYDANGNLLEDGDGAYTFNAQNRMTRYQRGENLVADYAYDYQGRRILRNDWVGGVQTLYVRDQDGRLLSEFTRPLSNPAAQAVWVRDHVYAEDRLVASIQDTRPSPPSGVETATSVANGTPDFVELTFSPNVEPDVESYRIWRTPPFGTQSSKLIFPGSADPVVFYDPNVTEGVSYTYSVSAVDTALNESERTRQFVIMPGDNTPPPQPGAPLVTPGDKTIDLTWSYAAAPADFYGFLVFGKEWPIATWTQLTPKPISGTAFSRSGLTNDAGHEYFLVAVDTAGLTSPMHPNDPGFNDSAIGWGVPFDSSAPGAPNGLLANAHATSVDLWWTPNPEADVSGYRIARSPTPMDSETACAPGQSGVVLADVPPQDSYVSSSLIPNATYYFRLCAMDDDGNRSEASSELAVRTRALGGPDITLSSVAFGVCANGFGNRTGDADLAWCTLPENRYFTAQDPDLYVETPFSHENYRRLTASWQDPNINETSAQFTGFQLYRRLNAREPWTLISNAAQNPFFAWGTASDPIGLRYPLEQTFLSGEPIPHKVLYFNTSPEDFCSPTMEYTLAPRGDYGDPNSEGDFVSPITVQSVLPAPENIRAVGYGAMNPPGTTAPKYLQISWDSYKGACRTDYRGVRLYRRRACLTSSQYQPVAGSCANLPSAIIEITDQPLLTQSVILGTDDLPHYCDGLDSVCSVSLDTGYAISARAVDANDAASMWSNAVCLRPKVYYGTNNGTGVVEEHSSHVDNMECNTFRFFPDGVDWRTPAPTFARATDPNLALSLRYPYGSSWDMIDIRGIAHLSGSGEVVNNVKKINVYKGPPPSGQTEWELVKSLPGDERFFAINGWSPVLPLPSETQPLSIQESANPVTDCDPRHYRMTWVDLGGRESDPNLAGPISVSRAAVITVTGNDPNTGTVSLEWSRAPFCTTPPDGYIVYKADAPDYDPNNYDPNFVGCESWMPSDPNELIRLTDTPLPGTESVYVDASASGSVTETESYTAGSGAPTTPVAIAPGDTSAPGPYVTTETPTLQWQAASGAEKYGVKVLKKQSDGTWNTVYNSENAGEVLLGTTFELPDGVLVDEKKYKWKVRAYNTAGGWSNYSDPRYFRADLDAWVPPDDVKYFVRVLMPGDDPNNPNVNWPPPPNSRCVAVQQARHDLNQSPEASWAVAALRSPEGGQDGEIGGTANSNADLLTESPESAWSLAMLQGEDVTNDHGRSGESPTLGGLLSAPGGVATDDRLESYGGRLEVVDREGVEVIPGWVELFGRGGPLLPGPELRTPPEEPTATMSAVAKTVAAVPAQRAPEDVEASDLWPSPTRAVGQSAPVTEILYYHTDHLGSPVRVTNELGEEVSRHKYLPFGEEMTPFGADTHNRRFTGHERDRESGLDYMLSRYYAAPMGRFLSVDPGDDTDPLNPQSWNKYTYVRNNPINGTDPTGESLQDVIDASIGVIRGMAASLSGGTIYGSTPSGADSMSSLEGQALGSAIVGVVGAVVTGVGAVEAIVTAPTVVAAAPGVAAVAAGTTAVVGATNNLAKVNEQKGSGAKSRAEFNKHQANLDAAKGRLGGLKEKLDQAKGPKAKEPIQQEINKLDKDIKGHEKEIRQKWPDGAPEE